MKGWRSLTSASLLDTQEEIEAVSEADLLRESSDSDSEPSVVPNSSQTSDDSWMRRACLQMHSQEMWIPMQFPGSYCDSAAVACS